MTPIAPGTLCLVRSDGVIHELSGTVQTVINGPGRKWFRDPVTAQVVEYDDCYEITGPPPGPGYSCWVARRHALVPITPPGEPVREVNADEVPA